MSAPGRAKARAPPRGAAQRRRPRRGGTVNAPAFPAALTDTRAFDIARAMLDGFDRHYRLFRQASAEAKQRFEAADWHGQQRAQRERIEFYDLRVDEAAERLQREFEAASLKKDVWQQVKLHYIGLLDRPPPARARRDLLQFGDDEDPAPQLLPQRLHLHPPGGLDRVHRERRAGRAADLPRLLPDRARRCARRGCASSTTSSSPASSRTSSATSTRCCAPSSAQLGESACAPTSRSRCCRRCSTGTRARTWSARSSTASTRRRSRCRSCTAATASSTIDTALFGEDDLLLLFSFARAYFMVAMEVPSAYVQFLRSLMPKKPRSEIYSALGLQKQGKNTLLPRLPDAHAAFVRHLPHRARHQGHGDAGVRPAELPVRLQGHQGLLSGAEGNDARADQVEVPAREAARPRRPDGRHARVQQRRLPARPLRRRAGRRAAPLLPEPARGRRRRAGDPPRLHRAPDGPAQHLPARRDAGADRAGGGRVRQRDQGPGAREHLPRRHAVEELRRHAPRQGRVLRLRRDRVPDRLQLPQGAEAAQRGRGDVRRGLVHGRPEGRLPGDVRAVPARQSGGPRGLHEAPRRPARRRLLARPQGADPGRLRA